MMILQVLGILFCYTQIMDCHVKQSMGVCFFSDMVVAVSFF